MESSKNNIKSSGWAVIPTHILSKILVMSGMPADEVVCNVALVCRSWWQALSGPYYWSNVDLYEWCRRGHQTAEIDETVKMFVARSAGILRSLSVYKIGEAAFTYACYSGKFLRVLHIPKSEVRDDTFVTHLEFLPVLEELDISYCLYIKSRGIYFAGKYCQRLVTLRRNMPNPHLLLRNRIVQSLFDETEGKAVADSMPRLQYLEMGLGLFDEVTLQSILRNCKGLRVLDIRGCLNVNLNDDLINLCHSIQTFKRPWDDVNPWERGYDYYSEFDFIVPS